MGNLTRFPSPIGESYFSIIIYCRTNNRKCVSVPYRGILFFNRHTVHIFRRLLLVFPSPIGESYFSISIRFKIAKTLIVSVPYRGILFFNLRLILMQQKKQRKRFRPLSGNLIFQTTSRDRTKEKRSFRPLSGNLIFQLFLIAFIHLLSIWFPSPIGESYFSTLYVLDNMDLLVSVPYRGILFFNVRERIYEAVNQRFRPLSGNLIFQ